MCTRIGCLFTVLSEAKMQVSPDKSLKPERAFRRFALAGF